MLFSQNSLSSTLPLISRFSDSRVELMRTWPSCRPNRPSTQLLRNDFFPTAYQLDRSDRSHPTLCLNKRRGWNLRLANWFFNKVQSGCAVFQSEFASAFSDSQALSFHIPNLKHHQLSNSSELLPEISSTKFNEQPAPSYFC